MFRYDGDKSLNKLVTLDPPYSQDVQMRHISSAMSSFILRVSKRKGSPPSTFASAFPLKQIRYSLSEVVPHIPSLWAAEFPSPRPDPFFEAQNSAARKLAVLPRAKTQGKSSDRRATARKTRPTPLPVSPTLSTPISSFPNHPPMSKTKQQQGSPSWGGRRDRCRRRRSSVREADSSA